MKLIEYKKLNIYENDNKFGVDWSKNGVINEWFNMCQLDSLLNSIRYTDPFDYNRGEFEIFYNKLIRSEKLNEINKK